MDCTCHHVDYNSNLYESRLKRSLPSSPDVVIASVDLYLIIKSRNQQYDIEKLIKELRENEGR